MHADHEQLDVPSLELYAELVQQFVVELGN
jgi:hypothetical protein